MPEPFRDENHAALERVAGLEDENAALRTQLAETRTPAAQPRGLPLWLVLTFVLVPFGLMIAGLASAFFLRQRHDVVL